MCPWSGSTLIRYSLDLKTSVWWTSFLSIMAFVTLWPWLPLDLSEPFCTHFASKHYPPPSIGTVLLVRLLRCTTMAMALSNKDVHQCLRRSLVHKRLAFGNSLNSVLLLLYGNLKLRYRYFLFLNLLLYKLCKAFICRLTSLSSSLKQHNKTYLGLFLTY